MKEPFGIEFAVAKFCLTAASCHVRLLSQMPYFPRFKTSTSYRSGQIMIGVLIFPDFQLLDAAGPISVFEIATRHGRR